MRAPSPAYFTDFPFRSRLPTSATEFFFRLRRRTRKMGETFLPGGLKWCAAGVGLASACIIVRGGYRTAELMGGFDGAIMDNETIFRASSPPSPPRSTDLLMCGQSRRMRR